MSNNVAPAKKLDPVGATDNMLYYAIIVNRLRKKINRRQGRPGLPARRAEVTGPTALSQAIFPGHAIGPVPLGQDRARPEI
jgi:hypothetical protein